MAMLEMVLHVLAKLQFDPAASPTKRTFRSGCRYPHSCRCDHRFGLNQNQRFWRSHFLRFSSVLLTISFILLMRSRVLLLNSSRQFAFRCWNHCEDRLSQSSAQSLRIAELLWRKLTIFISRSNRPNSFAARRIASKIHTWSLPNAPPPRSVR